MATIPSGKKTKYHLALVSIIKIVVAPAGGCKVSVTNMANTVKLNAMDKLNEVTLIKFKITTPIEPLIICPNKIFFDRENGLCGKVKIITQLAAIGGINNVTLV